MDKERTAIVVGGLLLLLICIVVGLAWDRQRRLDTEQYAVCSALINEKYVTPGIDLIVIADHTVTEMPAGSLAQLDERLLQSLRELPGIDQGILGDFQARNQQSHPLAARFTLPVQTALISKEEYDAIFEEGGWEGFYQRYPNSQGIMTLSMVGFSAQLDKALIYVGDQAGYLAGAGFFVSLAKVNDLWTLQSELMVWVS